MADITEKTGNTLFTHLYGGRGEKKRKQEMCLDKSET